ncbi:hypothetical protein FB45DRAFT_69202 [Roridomyces roridus]|uniref:F-box domain-containing protein n=1 Tax=Roridomyces roridus TaxID=1738132 RepID=A0AAD7FKM7_9AGAR|nr:hypothetical protein FB45DRAFT_69202 [Roridomyces roridus]
MTSWKGTSRDHGSSAQSCGRWRSIALFQPSLWAHISLDFSPELDFDEVNFDARFALLEAHLGRSAEAPLTVKFQCYSDGDCITRDEEYRALDILKKHSHRWQTLEMVGPKPLFTYLGNTFSLLRNLDVYVYPETDEDDVGALATFASCPRLQVATVNEGRFGSSSRVLLPDHLRRYKAGNLVMRHLEVLRSASDSLVECVLHVADDSTPLPSHTPRIPLPDLLRLSVSGATILDALDTPALGELYCFRPSPPLYSFLARQKTLRKLVVGEMSSADDITQLLHSLSSIPELGLYVPMEFASDFLKALAPSQGPSPTLLPSLTTLNVGFIPLRDFQVIPAPIDQDLLMQTIEAQWQTGGLRSVNFYCMRMSPSQELLARMRVLRDQGLKIELFTSPRDLDRVMIPRYFDNDDKPYSSQDLWWGIYEAEQQEQNQ